MKKHEQIIGRETMISRIIDFETKRLERINKDVLHPSWENTKYSYWKEQTIQKIKKEYKRIFEDVDFYSNSADFDGGFCE